MDKYELVVVVDAALSPDKREHVIKDIGETIVKCGGKVINSKVWLEKHKFSFPMKKRLEGAYYLINFEGKRSGNVELRHLLRVNEEVLRSMILQAQA
ncbi:MAG: 30S ribosomal protein S6 [Candidatus Omnitrophica bacterium]|nr:30S ribosomal protein S6 [Candidatus Omnitrophota bacterium]